MNVWGKGIFTNNALCFSQITPCSFKDVTVGNASESGHNKMAFIYQEYLQFPGLRYTVVSLKDCRFFSENFE